MGVAIMAATISAYPAGFEIDYQPQANRLTTFFRLIITIPILIIQSLLGNILFVPVLLMLLFRKKYPRWWFEWNLNLSRFSFRISAYLLLLTHEYPSTDDEQSVHLQIEQPDASQLSRGLPLIKWFLAIPHIIVLYFLFIAVVVLTFISWFAILFTGRYPQSFFNFVIGVMRWMLRVQAYAILLTTDKYPPFSLQP